MLIVDDEETGIRIQVTNPAQKIIKRAGIIRDMDDFTEDLKCFMDSNGFAKAYIEKYHGRIRIELVPTVDFPKAQTTLKED